MTERGTSQPGAPRKGKGPTAVMLQHQRAKEQYPDALIFFRLGDFYELFHEDAKRASEILGLTLTKRGLDDEGDPIAMAGVPHHAAGEYLARLLEAGEKVAFCEQMVDPSTVKGIVPREVVRVVSPGLCLDRESLDERTENFLAAVTHGTAGFEIAAYDLTTGRARVFPSPTPATVLADLVRLEPREVLLDEDVRARLPGVDRVLPRAFFRRADVARDDVVTRLLADHDASLAPLSPRSRDALMLVLGVAQANQPAAAIVLDVVEAHPPNDELLLDEAAIRSLELVRTTSGQREGALLHRIDRTRTAMGARLLRRRLLAPLAILAPIRRRLDQVEALFEDPALARELATLSRGIADVERLSTRASLGVATPRDLGAIRDSLEAAQLLLDAIVTRGSLVPDAPLAPYAALDLVTDLRSVLAASLVDAPPLDLGKGGAIRPGFDEELDELRNAGDGGRELVLAMEQRERARTGIASLKIKYNRIFGYSIEITRANLAHVPADYVRKQTIANGERFVTEELGKLEDRIVHAEERSLAREAQLFADLRLRVAEAAPRLRALSRAIAELDVLQSHATVALECGFVKPDVDTGLAIELIDARHPVVEAMAAPGGFVPNDVALDVEGERLAIITGPNMAGKSTIMRQTALAVVLAQMGAFVPATRARIGLVDRLFSRVGASDDVSRGQSTFMVEMREAADILAGATHRSLVIVDEIGRGTSTYDGLAIAWAVAEHLHDVVRCRCLFATHYHEICALAESRGGVANWNVLAREQGDDVVFLHRLARGAANRSYGISVARLAGVPALVLARARAVLGHLEAGERPTGPAAPAGKTAATPQLELFRPPAAESEVEKTLRGLDVERLTPVEALVALDRLRAMLLAKET